MAAQAQDAAVNELFGLGYDFDKKLDSFIEAVTVEQVVAAARDCFGQNYVLGYDLSECQPVSRGLPPWCPSGKASRSPPSAADNRQCRRPVERLPWARDSLRLGRCHRWQTGRNGG